MLTFFVVIQPERNNVVINDKIWWSAKLPKLSTYLKCVRAWDTQPEIPSRGFNFIERCINWTTANGDNYWSHGIRWRVWRSEMHALWAIAAGGKAHGNVVSESKWCSSDACGVSSCMCTGRRLKKEVLQKTGPLALKALKTSRDCLK